MILKLHHPFQSLLAQTKKYPLLAQSFTALGLTLLCGLAFWWHLGSIGLIDETEPLFAEAARQMTVTGDWVTPYFNGVTRFDKPPLVYWLMAIAYQVIGVNEWAVRFPSALSATLLTVGGFFTLRAFGLPIPAIAPDREQAHAQRQWVAWIGAGMMAFNLQTLVWARTGVSDMLLSGCLGLALMAFFWGYAAPANTRPKRLGYLGFYLFCALAVLTKGPVGIVLPGLVVIAFLIYVGQVRAVLREAMLGWGILLFVAIALPWFLLVIQANGQAYIDSFFGYHNFERFTRVVNRHGAPWYFYFLIVLGGFAPYSLYLPSAILNSRFWRLQEWRSQPRSTHLGLFALAWFGVIFGFFTIAVTKLPSYVLPLIPAASILVALFWGSVQIRTPQSLGWRIVQGLTIPMLGCMAVGMWLLPRVLDTDLATPDFSAAMWAAGVPLRGAVVWGGGAIASLLLVVRRQGRWLWGIQLATFALFISVVLLPALFVMDAQRHLPIRQMATEILQQRRPKEPILMLGFPKPSLAFYLQHPVRFLPNSEAARPVFRQMSRRNQPSALALGLRYRIVESDLEREDFTDLYAIGKYSLVRIEFPIEKYRDLPPLPTIPPAPISP